MHREDYGYTKKDDMVILQLNLHREFFREILEGTKKVEYRDRTPYWENRLTNKKYTHIRFRNGYLTVAPEMIVELKRIKKTDDVYQLHLGEIVSKKHVRMLK
jgi:hypothetical protein